MKLFSTALLGIKNPEPEIVIEPDASGDDPALKGEPEIRQLPPKPELSTPANDVPN